MKKFMLLGTLVALVLAALALPAMAQDGFFGENQKAFDHRLDRWQEQAKKQGYSDEDLYGYLYDRFAGYYGDDDNQQWDDNDPWNDNQRWDDNDQRNDNQRWDDNNRRYDNNWWNDNDRNNDVPAVSQENELDAESGDVSQSFNVSNTGSNSNQCVGINGTANTGNAQNATGVIQYGSEAGDFEFEDSGATINVDGSSTTTCDQQVNQAAAAG